MRRVVDMLFREFNGISINTYVDHPEGWSAELGWNTQTRSLDVWDVKGRGVPIDREKGDRIVARIFNDPNPPWIAWIIWEGYIWTPDTGGWVPFDDDGTGLHFDHPHITFFPG